MGNVAKVPENFFEWIKDTFQLNEDFIKHCNKESDECYFVEFDVQYHELVHELLNFSFLPERMKIDNSKIL